MINQIKKLFEDTKQVARPNKTFRFSEVRNICYILSEPNAAAIEALREQEKAFNAQSSTILMFYDLGEKPHVGMPHLTFDKDSFDWRMRIKDVNLQGALEKEFDLCLLYADSLNPFVQQIIRKTKCKFLASKVEHPQSDLRIKTKPNDFQTFNKNLMELLPLLQTQ